MVNVDSRSGAKQQQQRRWSMGRSSTPRNHFSPQSSEAFYASTEPLSSRSGRTLHNASGSGPDPDSNSAPDSYGAPEAKGKQYRVSARTSQDAKDRSRTIATKDREYFYTVPRDLPISRKEILRRRSAKDETKINTEKEQARRPKTLPSIGRRIRQDGSEHTSSLLKKVSRQDILRRHASVEANSQVKEKVARTSSSFQDSRRTDRDFPRPSTLPKILHASRTSRVDEYVSTRMRETAGREAPIYGKIRRRKMSLPTGTGTLRDSTTSLNSLTRFSRSKASGERTEAATKTIRHLRDPVPDPSDRSRFANDASDDAKVTRKLSRRTSREEKLEPIDRIMSRRRIISNADQMDSLERRMHQDRDQDIVKIRHDAILVSKADIERLRNFKTGRSNQDTKTTCRADSTWSRRRDLKTESWSRKTHPPKDSANDRQINCRSKSQCGLSMEGPKEIPKTKIRPTTLPSYVKIGRKASSTDVATRNANEPKRTSNSETLTKQSKERSNYVRKTATRTSTHLRALSDATSARSNSPETPSSIFGFCTGRRKIQTSSCSRSFPSWNLKTVRQSNLEIFFNGS